MLFRSNGLEFQSYHVNIPMIAKNGNMSEEEGMMEYEKVSRQALEDGTYHDPYHVKPIELTKKRQRNVFLVQHLLGWARYLF